MAYYDLKKKALNGDVVRVSGCLCSYIGNKIHKGI
jgi:hypothetical protein